jgi:nitrite reductase/ring-hydroxylating ferredoxin subunit
MLHSTLHSRRGFVRRFVLGVAGSSLLGKSWKDPFLLELAAGEPVTAGLLHISLNDFPVLRNELGSMRLSVNPIASDHFPEGNHYPVIINHAGGGRYFAMSSECSHAHCVVDAFDSFEQGMLCPCHGSLYDITGQRIQGPAKRGLKPYVVAYDGQDLLTVTVPGLAYRVTPTLRRGLAGSRLALSFPTWPNVSYEVRFRARLNDPGTVVPFGLSADGPLDQTLWLGDDQPVTVFVDPVGDRGFLEVSLVLLDLG